MSSLARQQAHQGDQRLGGRRLAAISGSLLGVAHNDPKMLLRRSWVEMAKSFKFFRAAPIKTVRTRLRQASSE